MESDSASTIFLAGFVGGLTSQGLSVAFDFIRERIFGRKADTKAAINEAIEKLSSICGIAEIAWNNPVGKDRTKQYEIVCQIHELSELMDYIWHHHQQHKSKLQAALSNFHNVVTGDDFDTYERPAKAEKIIAIRGRASSLKVTLMKLRREL